MTQEELNKAAEESWALYEYSEHPQGLYASCYQDGFLAGYKLAMEQGESYDTRVMMNGLSGYSVVHHSVESFEPDEEVIIQIRKKDE